MAVYKLSFAVLIFVFIIHFISPVSTVTDSRWALHTSMAIIKTHHTNLDEYRPLIESEKYYGAVTQNGHLYYYFPLGTPILIMPIVKSLDYFLHHTIYADLNNYIKSAPTGGIEVFIASLLIALSSVFILLIGLQITESIAFSLILVFCFAFCTSAWSTASRALWSHSGSLLMLSGALWSLLKAQRNERWLFIAALFLGYSYIVRPTNCVAIMAFSAYVTLTQPRRLPGFLAGLALIIMPFLLYNYHIYHTLLSPYYLPSRVGGSQHLMEGLIGNLVSPNRGLLIFSPILIFSIAGAVLKFKYRHFNSFDAAVLVIILGHYYIISSISSLYGGWCFGPRLFTDVIPFFMYFLAYFFKYLSNYQIARFRPAFFLAFMFCTLLSFYINYRGAFYSSTFMWNAAPANIDDHPERVWDWKDLQFLR